MFSCCRFIFSLFTSPLVTITMSCFLFATDVSTSSPSSYDEILESGSIIFRYPEEVHLSSLDTVSIDPTLLVQRQLGVLRPSSLRRAVEDQQKLRREEIKPSSSMAYFHSLMRERVSASQGMWGNNSLQP